MKAILFILVALASTQLLSKPETLGSLQVPAFNPVTPTHQSSTVLLSSERKRQGLGYKMKYLTDDGVVRRLDVDSPLNNN